MNAREKNSNLYTGLDLGDPEMLEFITSGGDVGYNGSEMDEDPFAGVEDICDEFELSPSNSLESRVNWKNVAILSGAVSLAYAFGAITICKGVYQLASQIYNSIR